MVEKLDCWELKKGVRKGEALKAPRYASAAVTRDYITTRNIIPNTTKYFHLAVGIDYEYYKET